MTTVLCCSVWIRTFPRNGSSVLGNTRIWTKYRFVRCCQESQGSERIEAKRLLWAVVPSTNKRTKKFSLWVLLRTPRLAYIFQFLDLCYSVTNREIPLLNVIADLKESQNCRSWQGPLKVVQFNPLRKHVPYGGLQRKACRWVLNLSSLSTALLPTK